MALKSASTKGERRPEGDLGETSTGRNWREGNRNHAEDAFMFKLNPPEEIKLTKRGILSQIARLFEPIGFTVRAKIGIQQLWQRGLEWDKSCRQQCAKNGFVSSKKWKTSAVMPEDSSHLYPSYCRNPKQFRFLSVETSAWRVQRIADHVSRGIPIERLSDRCKHWTEFFGFPEDDWRIKEFSAD